MGLQPLCGVRNVKRTGEVVALQGMTAGSAGGLGVGGGFDAFGHDVEVGDGATISSNVVVAGRARIGARAWIGASATISNAVCIGDGAEVRLGSVVIQDVADGGDVSGNFARGHAGNMKRYLKELRDGA